jgi:hypothetical protein
MPQEKQGEALVVAAGTWLLMLIPPRNHGEIDLNRSQGLNAIHVFD